MKDPLDLNNITAAHANIIKRMAKELDAWKHATLAGKLQAGGEGDASLSSEGWRGCAHALGYL